MTEQEHSEDIQDLTGDMARLQAEIVELKARARSFEIACFNITELNDRCQALTEYSQKLADTLTRALTLVDNLIGEMRHANVVPSAPCVFTKAALDQAMQQILAMGRRH